MVYDLAAPEFFTRYPPPVPNSYTEKSPWRHGIQPHYATLCDRPTPWPPHDPHRSHHSVSTRAPGHFVRPNPLRALLAHPGAFLVHHRPIRSRSPPDLHPQHPQTSPASRRERRSPTNPARHVGAPRPHLTVAVRPGGESWRAPCRSIRGAARGVYTPPRATPHLHPVPGARSDLLAGHPWRAPPGVRELSTLRRPPSTSPFRVQGTCTKRAN